jgi:hypothetical protein
MELKPIDRTDRGKSRLHAALRIYRETILPEAQNPERQILYWIDHSKDDLADEFRCFSIQRAGEVFGYLQYSYFREEHILFCEYLCLRDIRRTGLVPSEALKSIEDYLAQNYRPNFTIVFEVAHNLDGSGQWKPDKKLLGYFKRLGFRTVEFNYRYPILQSYDGSVGYPADLMVQLPENRTVVSPSELRTILRCIYFKHYLRWDRPFLDPERFGERERLINELYSQEVGQINGTGGFGTSGDGKRTGLARFRNIRPHLWTLMAKIFGPRLLQVIILGALILVAQRFLGNIWLLAPFVLALGAIHCLAENTDASRKLFVLIISRFHVGKPRSL